MIKHIYALKSEYLDAFDNPIFTDYAETDQQELYRRSVLSDPDAAYKGRANEKALFYLGTFDEVSGDIHPVCKKVCTLAGLFPPGYLAKKEAQSNGTNEIQIPGIN